jgi:transcriptional regulator with XRE-family HTH domain
MNPATSPQDTPQVSPQVLAGRTLRMIRETHGASLRQVADLAGISPSHLSRVEAGERPATAELTERLCAVLANLPRESA